MKNCAIILAAGRGSRLGSKVPKPLVKIKNKEIINHIIDTFSQFKNTDIIVVVNDESPIIDAIQSKCKFVFQLNPKGTAHAIKSAFDEIIKYDQVFISVGDSPLVSYDSLHKMQKNHNDKNIDCSFLTSDFPIHYPYACIVRNQDMKIIKCVEYRDANSNEKKITERLSSHYLINSKIIQSYINSIKPNSNTKEEYLTDIIDILIKNKKTVEGYKVKDYRELIGINTPEDLAEIERIITNE